MCHSFLVVYYWNDPKFLTLPGPLSIFDGFLPSYYGRQSIFNGLLSSSYSPLSIFNGFPSINGVSLDIENYCTLR